ncbi:MAG: glycoside hydrolase family 31 protein [Acidobacteriota bacterium]
MRFFDTAANTGAQKTKRNGRHLSAGLTSLAALLLGFGVLEIRSAPVGLMVQEDRSRLTAITASYSMEIQKSPYGLAVLQGARRILAHASSEAGHGGHFEIAGRKYGLGTVTSWRHQGRSLFLSVLSQPQEMVVQVALHFNPHHIDVRWDLETAAQVTRVEERFQLETSGHWYGGNVTSAHQWPLETAEIELDPFLSTSNQTAPVWLTSNGAALLARTYRPLAFALNRKGNGLFHLSFKDGAPMEYQILVGRNIVEAFRSFVELVGKPRTVPPREYFAQPVFNTWIEFLTRVSQVDVAAYARKIRELDFPAGILELDDGWACHYGDHRFDPQKFPDPKQMVSDLHKLGFKFGLWTIPFVEEKAENFQLARQNGYLIRDPEGQKPALIQWWNGTAGLVDFSNPAAYDWFAGQLGHLQREYAIDGFKLDGGDAEYFAFGFASFGHITPNRYTDLYASLGSRFAINELRVSWLVQELGLVQRLRDKSSDWTESTGLGSLVPHGLAESILGYPFFCPDIIGGGLDESFKGESYQGMDAEMFVRWTQASALMPMMQFSFAPWRLDARSLQICRQYAKLHEALGDYIYDQALRSRDDGTPIVRPLFFRNPEDQHTYLIKDQFLLGDRFLVAPVLTKGASHRDIYLPSGLWKDFWSGEIQTGPRTLKAFPAPLEKLPIFVHLD